MAEPISGRASRLVTASALAGAILLVAPATSAVAPATQGTSPDWSRYIIGLLPAIQVCVRDVPEKPAVVTGAYRIEGARIGGRPASAGPARPGRTGGEPALTRA
jgi:hypothetical protein